MARVQREKVLKIDRPFRAGGFVSLTGPLAPRVVVAASPQIKKRGAAGAAGCVEGLCSLRSGGDSACSAEGGGIALSGDEYKVSVTGFTFCVI